MGLIIIVLVLLCLYIIMYITRSKRPVFSNHKEQFYYPNGKKMAYISTWDDTHNIESYIKINDLCKHENIKIPITMFLSSDRLKKYVKTSPEIIKKYKILLKEPVGHTIESHSIKHSENPDNIPEYTQSQIDIRDVFGKKYAKTYCYPYGIPPKKEETRKAIKNTYLAARSTTHGYFNSSQLHNLPCFGIEKIVEDDIKKTIAENKTIISYGHGIKEIGGWNPISEKDFLNHLRVLKKYESQIWFTTLPKFIEYLYKTKQL